MSNEAQRLAGALDASYSNDQLLVHAAANELRRLDAANRELLEALKSMCEGFKPLKDADFPALAKARAAIAKAEGKP